MPGPSRRPAVQMSALVVLFGVAAVGVAATAWTALALAAAGRFDARLALGVGVFGAALCVATAVRAVRHGRLRFRSTAEDVAADAACLLVIALGVLRLGPAVPWPAALDGGWYAATAVRIATDRSLSFHAPAAAIDGFVMPLAALRSAGIPAPNDDSRGFHAVAFAVPRIGEPWVTPYHPPLFASWAAVGVARHGPYGSARAAGWSAALWLLAVAALARALGLRAGAPAATAVAALSPQFRVYGATPYAELFAGALAIAALVALATIDRGRPLADETGVPPLRGGDDEGVPTGATGGAAIVLAAAAGAAAGTAVVAKIDVVPLALATGIVWLVAAPTGRSRVAFVVGASAACAALIALVRGPTSVYAALNGYGVWRLLRAFGAEWGPPLIVVLGLLCVAVLVVFAARSRPSRRRGARPTGDQGRRLAPPWHARVGMPGVTDAPAAGVARLVSVGAVAGAVLLAAALWQSRPADAGPTGMVRLLAWSVTPLGLFAAAIGLARIVDDRRRAAPVLWPLLAASAFVLAVPIVTRDLSPLYAARRLAPIAVPAACVLAAVGIERAVAGQPTRRRAALAAVTGVALAAAALQSGRLRPSREFAAVELLVDRIADHTAPGDLVLFPSPYGSDLSARLAAPLWALRDIDVAVLPHAAADPERIAPGASVADALGRWSAAYPGARVLWVAAPATQPPARTVVEAIGDESLITEAWAPGVLPPDLSPIELTVGIGILSREGDGADVPIAQTSNGGAPPGDKSR